MSGPERERQRRHQGDKYATPDSTRGRIDDGPLRADHRRLFMLYWAARASDVLITPLVLNESSAFRARKWLRALFEIARVLVRFDHVASFIVNANHGGVSPHPTHYSGVGLCLLRGQVEGYGLKFSGSDCEYIVY